MTTDKYSLFASKVAAQVDTNSEVADKCKEHLRLSLVWSAKHLEADSSKHCELLLKGSYGTAVEAVSLLAFGLVRPAILSLRSHYELSLQFLYYRDHPVEWRNVIGFRHQPNLPSINRKYLKDNYPKFEGRLEKLTKAMLRANEDCYGVLSGIAHGTAIHSISQAVEPEQLVEEVGVVAFAEKIFVDVSETICDINVSCFESNWSSLPQLVQSNLTDRFNGKSPQKVLDI